MSEVQGSLCPKCGMKLLQDKETGEWVCAYCGFISNVSPSGTPRTSQAEERVLQKRLQLLSRVAEQFGPDKVEAILKDDPDLKRAWHLQLVRDVSLEFGREKAGVLVQDNPELKPEWERAAEPVETEVPDWVKPGSGPSGVWYLVPLLFGILGGIVAYVAVKDKDRGMADRCLVLGLLLFFMELFYILLVFSI